MLKKDRSRKGLIFEILLHLLWQLISSINPFNRGKGRNGNNLGRDNGRGNNNGQFSGGQSTQFPTGQSQFFGLSYNGQGQFSPSQSQSKSSFQQGQRPVCQIYGKSGHTARIVTIE